MNLLNRLHTILSPGSSLDEFYISSIPLFKIHRILFLAAYEVLSAENLQPETRKAARTALYEARSAHLIYTNRLKAVIRMLEEQGTDYILLKGASLWKYYPQPYLREQDDIDILIRAQDTDRLSSIITETWNTKIVRTGPFHLSCALGSTAGPCLEIHTETAPPDKNRISPDTLFSHTETESINGLSIRTLSFPFLFQHVAFHAANHRLLTRIQWLNDLCCLARTSKDYSFLKELKGIRKRSCAAALCFAARIFQSSSLEQARKELSVSSLFLFFLEKAVPPDRLLTNPVLTSRLRNILYNLLLIQNPVSILRTVWRKMH